MVILITGASSGIGNEAAKMLAAQGHKVYAAARRTELLEPLRAEGIVPVRLDVTDEESCRSCIKTITDAEGRIDALACGIARASAPPSSSSPTPSCPGASGTPWRAS